jgi:TRAP-type C4-dicarboxylate transport system permease small subunit
LQTLMKSLEPVTGALARAALWVAGLGLVLMTTIIAAQVFSRYVLGSSIIWSEPSAVMIMGWFIFLGAAVGIKEGYHLSFDVLLYVIPDRGKQLFHCLSDLAVASFGGGMVWYGWSLAANVAGNIIPSLGISGLFDFLPVILGGILIVLFSLERIARRLAGLQTARFGEAVED